MRKICIITGSRAEWGLLCRLAALIRDDSELQLQIIATNMHLSERYGMTYREIENDGFAIDYKIPMNSEGDLVGDTVRSMAFAMAGFAAAYDKLDPDLIIVLGDRYEILVAVSGALIYKIPVAHLHGGEITVGAYDDSIRHAVTKMSHMHFTSTEQYKQRVIQLGEQPSTVFNVGAIGVDNIKNIPLLSKKQTEDSLGGFELNDRTFLVTFHPVTLENNNTQEQMCALLEAFEELPNSRVIFTMPNSDTGNYIITQMIIDWCDKNNHRAVYFKSLGSKRYLSTLQFIRAVVGNSSSGIIEVPSFGIHTLNIGDRQKGRICAESVIHCQPVKNCIYENLVLIMQKPVKVRICNPYDGGEGTAIKIVELIKSETIRIQKIFYNVNI